MAICKNPSDGVCTELLPCPSDANSLHAGCNRAGCTAGLAVPDPLVLGCERCKPCVSSLELYFTLACVCLHLQRKWLFRCRCVFDTVSRFSAKGWGYPTPKLGIPKGALTWWDPPAWGWCCGHDLICAQNINTCCCRHAACGFRSTFVKTTFSPSTAAAKSFSRNPILAIREGFKRNLATATVVPFADLFFF